MATYLQPTSQKDEWGTDVGVFGGDLAGIQQWFTPTSYKVGDVINGRTLTQTDLDLLNQRIGQINQTGWWPNKIDINAMLPSQIAGTADAWGGLLDPNWKLEKPEFGEGDLQKGLMLAGAVALGAGALGGFGGVGAEAALGTGIADIGVGGLAADAAAGGLGSMYGYGSAAGAAGSLADLTGGYTGEGFLDMTSSMGDTGLNLPDLPSGGQQLLGDSGTDTLTNPAPDAGDIDAGNTATGTFNRVAEQYNVPPNLIQRLFNNPGDLANWAEVALKLGPSFLGFLATSKQAGLISEAQEKYWSAGQGARDLYNYYLTPDGKKEYYKTLKKESKLLTEEAYQGLSSAVGNPYGSGTALQQVARELADYKMNSYETKLNNLFAQGFGGPMSQAAQFDMAAATNLGNQYNAIGSGIASLTADTWLQDLMRQYLMKNLATAP